MVSYKQLINFVWQFMRQQKGVFLTIFLLDAFAWPLDSLMFPYILHLIVDIFTRFEADRAAAWGALQAPIWGAVGLMVYVEIASRTMGFLLAKSIPKLQADIRMEMFDHIQHHSPHYFNARFAGSLGNKLTDMTAQVELILQQLFWPILPSISACILGAGFFWFVNPLFTWVFLVWSVLHLCVCLKFARPADAYEHRHGEARTNLIGKILDSFTNNFAVNLFYRFRYEKNRAASFQKVEEETNREAKRFVEKMRCYLSLVYFIGGFLGINGLLLYFWVHGIITTGQVVQVFATMVSLATVLWNLSSSLPILFQSLGIAKQAYSLMLDAQDILDEPGATDLKVSSGEILFENVSFHYGERKLFQNKHVRIRGGEKIGLVGFTGAGKSTFINLILRFFPLDDGKILIDGQDISAVKLETLRKQIALIPQDPVLFHRTLRENICYGKPEADDEEIVRASKLAHCDGFIGRIPGGYEAKVGERGTKLSGGEKQRIAIARAILMDAPLLILDEATSALDSVTERYIQDSLEQLMKNRTTIVIAHRLSTLSRMDRILVFDQGKIVEEGSSDFLINKNGLYAYMWKMQVGGFLPDDPVS